MKRYFDIVVMTCVWRKLVDSIRVERPSTVSKQSTKRGRIRGALQSEWWIDVFWNQIFFTHLIKKTRKCDRTRHFLVTWYDIARRRDRTRIPVKKFFIRFTSEDILKRFHRAIRTTTWLLSPPWWIWMEVNISVIILKLQIFRKTNYLCIVNYTVKYTYSWYVKI